MSHQKPDGITGSRSIRDLMLHLGDSDGESQVALNLTYESA